MVLTTGLSFGQSIAVANINTYKVYADPASAATLVRLELFKIRKYSILDQFDMAEIANPDKYDDCYAKGCLLEFGEELNVDFVISGSIDKISDKIVVNLKLIDVNAKEAIKTATHEFANQEEELQRMVGIVVKKLHGLPSDQDLVKRLSFNNEVITSSKYSRVNNSGPRIGMAYAYGTLGEYMTRAENQGGADIVPIVSAIGYQFEAQYVGTENFSALFEFIPQFIGLEQGQMIPSLSILNGFRFGKAGWEFAFGPSFGLTKTSTGFFDSEGIYGSKDAYFSENDADFPSTTYLEDGYRLEEHIDKRGDTKFSTRWIVGFGRTFNSGALNIPVNIFHSSQKGGGMIGVSVGFNITRSKKKI
ncbi:MAG: hypothetical protein BM555_06300 [Crocinitomix sp. MedPE-SWsnd]|nr:MAG: hypothetical protein BM555_06300 [Crocinitomix sp. MedPE-SWsnd]